MDASDVGTRCLSRRTPPRVADRGTGSRCGRRRPPPRPRGAAAQRARVHEDGAARWTGRKTTLTLHTPERPRLARSRRVPDSQEAEFVDDSASGSSSPRRGQLRPAWPALQFHAATRGTACSTPSFVRRSSSTATMHRARAWELLLAGRISPRARLLLEAARRRPPVEHAASRPAVPPARRNPSTQRRGRRRTDLVADDDRRPKLSTSSRRGRRLVQRRRRRPSTAASASGRSLWFRIRPGARRPAAAWLRAKLAAPASRAPPDTLTKPVKCLEQTSRALRMSLATNRVTGKSPSMPNRARSSSRLAWLVGPAPKYLVSTQ